MARSRSNVPTWIWPTALGAAVVGLVLTQRRRRAASSPPTAEEIAAVTDIAHKIIAARSASGYDLPRVARELRVIGREDLAQQVEKIATQAAATGQVSVADDFRQGRVRLRGARIFAPYMIDPARITRVRADVLSAGTLPLYAYWPVQIVGEARIYAPYARRAAETGYGPSGRGSELISFIPRGNGSLVYRVRMRDPRVPTGLVATGWIFADELDAAPAPPPRAVSIPLQTAPPAIVVNPLPRAPTLGDLAASQAAKAAAFVRSR